ncbi:hypothetical protein CH63R_05977 [Colletotrichum higginsianum IMI 349063]|uniref:Uncharacterized protein n=1 Tax=Colletotrichum higginsianum (strain IMI 349063) TaxID=759273 RepID=A0A1B7YE23_COLHI|nr:hypothetical protein CH63R_05977 [Colletotrichum higginsianum IMI 349063]OBR10285.1 hypothetical protein CH63R_05977 [Colletotrichum higginsianum IMI 349063]
MGPSSPVQILRSVWCGKARTAVSISHPLTRTTHKHTHTLSLFPESPPPLGTFLQEITTLPCPETCTETDVDAVGLYGSRYNTSHSYYLLTALATWTWTLRLLSLRSRCPAPKKRQRPEPKRIIPKPHSFLPAPPLFFHSPSLIPSSSSFSSSLFLTTSSHRSQYSVLFILRPYSCRKPSDPAARPSSARSLLAFKFLTLLIRLPTHGVACDDLRFATPCERHCLLSAAPCSFQPTLFVFASFKSRSSQPAYPG